MQTISYSHAYNFFPGTSEEIIQVIVNPVLPSTQSPPYRPPGRPLGPTDERVARVPVGANYEFRCILTGQLETLC